MKEAKLVPTEWPALSSFQERILKLRQLGGSQDSLGRFDTKSRRALLEQIETLFIEIYRDIEAAIQFEGLPPIRIELEEARHRAEYLDPDLLQSLVQTAEDNWKQKMETKT